MVCEALLLLDAAPDSPTALSKINPNLTQADAVRIIRNGVLAVKKDVGDMGKLSLIYEQRVLQVYHNKKKVTLKR